MCTYLVCIERDIHTYRHRHRSLSLSIYIYIYIHTYIYVYTYIYIYACIIVITICCRLGGLGRALQGPVVLGEQFSIASYAI